MIIKVKSLILSIVLSSLMGCTLHNSIGTSAGTYVSSPDGQEFKTVAHRWDHEYSALVYVYRPASVWANDELEAPSFYVNDQHLFNLKGGSYTWFEFEPGQFEVVMRRPLMGVEGLAVNDMFDFSIKTPGTADLSVKAGQVYYLRYSEVDPVDLEQDESDPLFSVNGSEDNHLQLVPGSVALAELPGVKMLDDGRGRLKAKKVKEEVKTEPTYKDAKKAEDEAESSKTKEEQWWPF